MLNPFIKLARSVRERGWNGTVMQLYQIGDLKFGELKGTDKCGNKYYENLDLPYGQHRWVEYANAHNYDATMIPPEWHGWMHHVYDETPNDTPITPETIQTTPHSHALFGHHIGLVVKDSKDNQAQHDLSQYRQRGYGVGSLMTSENEPDAYYKQPGHPLSPMVDKGGRFEGPPNVSGWNPETARLEEEQAEQTAAKR